MSYTGAPQEDAKEHSDIADLITEAAHEIKQIRQPDGSVGYISQIDPEIFWWRTHIISSYRFGRFALLLMEWERMAEECYNNMHAERAKEMAKTILAISKSYRRSIDAKSSESVRDKSATQSILLDRMNRSQVERTYKLEGKDKKGILGMFAGKDDND